MNYDLTYRIIIRKVRVFFKNIKWKKILTFSFFLLLSTIFWVMQIYRQKFEATLSIPVKYVNVPDSIVFEQDLPSIIDVRIKDDGAALFQYYFTKRKDSLEIDVRRTIHNSASREIKGDEFYQLIRSKLLNNSEYLGASPSRVSLAFDVLREKRLPVIYDGYIDLSSRYIIDGELVIEPDVVIAYGTQLALDTLSFAHTQSDTLSGITEDKTIAIPIMPVKGVKFAPDQINLTIPIDEFNIKEVDVPIQCINLPNNLSIRFFPSTVRISFFVGKKRYKDIIADDFVIKVDYNAIKDQKSSTVPVRIVESPDYVKNITPKPTEVEFVMEQK